MTSQRKIATIQEKQYVQYVYFGFSKQSKLSQGNVITELSMKMIHLTTMLSDVG
jgi:hypothetical protein